MPVGSAQGLQSDRGIRGRLNPPNLLVLNHLIGESGLFHEFGLPVGHLDDGGQQLGIVLFLFGQHQRVLVTAGLEVPFPVYVSSDRHLLRSGLPGQLQHDPVGDRKTQVGFEFDAFIPEPGQKDRGPIALDGVLADANNGHLSDHGDSELETGQLGKGNHSLTFIRTNG